MLIRAPYILNTNAVARPSMPSQQAGVELLGLLRLSYMLPSRISSLTAGRRCPPGLRVKNLAVQSLRDGAVSPFIRGIPRVHCLNIRPFDSVFDLVEWILAWLIDFSRFGDVSAMLMDMTVYLSCSIHVPHVAE